MNQLTIYDQVRHNNLESQRHYDQNKEHFNSQRYRILERLMKGDRLTRLKCILEMNILDPVKRFDELKKIDGYLITDVWEGKIKAWFCTPEQIEYNKRLLNERG